MPERKHADLWNRVVDEAGEDEVERAATVSAEQAKAELTGAGLDAAAERAKANAFLEALESGTLGASPATSTPSGALPEAVSARSAPRSYPSAPRTIPTEAPPSGRNAPTPEAALPSAGAVPAPEKPPLASAAASAATRPVPLAPVPRAARRPAFPWLAAAASFVAGGVLIAALEPALVSGSHPPRADLVAAAADLRHQAAAACSARAWAVCLADLDKARVLDPDGDEAVKGLREKAVTEILK